MSSKGNFAALPFPKAIFKILMVILITQPYHFVYSQENPSAGTKHENAFIPCRQLTSVIYESMIDNGDAKFDHNIIAISRDQMTIAFNTDTLACETFRYYKLSDMPDRYLLIRNNCNQELLFLFFSESGIRQGCIRFETSLYLEMIGYRHRGYKNEILVNYSTGNPSISTCVFRFYDNSDQMEIILDAKEKK
jgi:hypothetical protein